MTSSSLSSTALILIRSTSVGFGPVLSGVPIVSAFMSYDSLKIGINSSVSEFTTARSIVPSPSKSPASTAASDVKSLGFQDGELYVACPAIPPVPSLKNMCNASAVVTTISSKPSTVPETLPISARTTSVASPAIPSLLGSP